MSFESITANSQLIVYFLVGLLIFFWIYSLLWVAKDISWRTGSFGLQLLSILLIVFLTPVIGLPIYILIRPPVGISRVSTVVGSDQIACASCGEMNSTEFVYCVFCAEKLKAPCKECKKNYAISYSYCPFCAAPNISTIE